VRVLVTGASSGLGAEIASQLDLIEAKVSCVEGSGIRDEAATLEAFILARPKVVIHAAGPGPGDSGDAYRSILDMGRNLVYACALMDAKLVLLNPSPSRDPHGAREAVAGMAAAYFEQTGDFKETFQYVRVMLPPLFGHDRSDMGNWVNQIAKVAVVGSAMNVQDWVLPGLGIGSLASMFVADAARAAIVAAGPLLSGSYEVRTTKKSVDDIAKAALKACGQTGEFRWSGAAGPWDLNVDNLHNELPDILPGLALETPLGEAVKATVERVAVHMQEQAGKA
jgi:nucleoside-diphosphate-sugar epimerase